PNQILVSRSYYEVVSRLAPDYAQLFQYVGLHRDKHVREHEVREHEVYEVQLAPGAHTSPPAPEEAARPGAASDPAGDRSVGGGDAGRFDPNTLAGVAAALAQVIGPVARVVVNRAAQRAADAETLCDLLAEHVPPASRAAFLAALADVLNPSRPASESAALSEPQAPAGAPHAPGRRGRSIDTDVLAQAERLLTLRIGPVARLLVRQATKSAANARELFENLAVHIDDTESRRRFLAEAEPLT